MGNIRSGFGYVWFISNHLTSRKQFQPAEAVNTIECLIETVTRNDIWGHSTIQHANSTAFLTLRP